MTFEDRIAIVLMASLIFLAFHWILHALLHGDAFRPPRKNLQRLIVAGWLAVQAVVFMFPVFWLFIVYGWIFTMIGLGGIALYRLWDFKQDELDGHKYGAITITVLFIGRLSMLYYS